MDFIGLSGEFDGTFKIKAQLGRTEQKLLDIPLQITE